MKRHPKASQANSTPVTDGRRVVALFGSIGLLAAWDVNGRPLWRQDVGVLDSGWFFDPDYQWGHSSSPIIHGDKVIVQADRYKGSFIAALYRARVGGGGSFSASPVAADGRLYFANEDGDAGDRRRRRRRPHARTRLRDRGEISRAQLKLRPTDVSSGHGLTSGATSVAPCVCYMS